MATRTHASRVAPERSDGGASAPDAQSSAADDTSAARGAPPVARISLGGVQASIWANHSDKGDFHTVTFTRRYQEGGEWKSSNSYGPTDLLALQKVADLAVNKIVELQQGRGRSA